MPGLNQTGPQGKGSRTGRGLGKCIPKKSENEIKKEQTNPETASNSGGRPRFGRRKGGQGNRNRFHGGNE